jgi:SAM-dependent methyltransferase
MVDVWGEIFKDHWAGRAAPYRIERDDGLEQRFDSAANYFEAPRSDAESELLPRITGPVLDLGAGAGSYALHLQRLGLLVTAADASPGAQEVCRARGCRDVRLADVRSLDLEPRSFETVIIMGNTVGAHQTPETFPGFLTRLSRTVKPRGYLLCSMIDPLETTEAVHLAYHRKNRERGLPPGLIRMRMKYKELADDWMHLWMPTEEELGNATSAAGWTMVEERREGPLRVRLFENAPD